MTAPEPPHPPEPAPPMWAQAAQPADSASARAKLIRLYQADGVSSVTEHACDYVRFHSRRIRLAVTARLLELLALNRSFQVENKRYRYLFHPHTTTWRNERCVEIPLAAEVLNAWSGKRILEVGNVLGHFMPTTHDVLDKYEHVDGVINEDVVEFTPAAPYDLILSISTLEHVGWDETELEPDKVRAAITRLTQILAPGGRLWVTVPRGYHRYLDRYVDEGTLPFTHLAFLKRTTRRDWHQVRHEDIKGIPYGVGFEGAIALMIAITDKPQRHAENGSDADARPY
jgi:hypothetical protein